MKKNFIEKWAWGAIFAAVILFWAASNVVAGERRAGGPHGPNAPPPVHAAPNRPAHGPADWGGRPIYRSQAPEMRPSHHQAPPPPRSAPPRSSGFLTLVLPFLSFGIDL